MSDVFYITTPDALNVLVAQIPEMEEVTLDTEFLRERTYYPELCLLQIGLRGRGIFLVDCIALQGSLMPLWDALLVDGHPLWIVHAGRQDLEIVRYLAGRLPQRLFDAQVAAMVCGFGEAVSFTTLVQKCVKVALDKSSQYSDWAKRPLSEKQLRYAAADVHYLWGVYDELKAEVERRGRMHWIADETASLLDPEAYEPPLDQLWKKLRLKLRKPAHVAVVQALALWREQQAMAENVNRTRIIRDEALVQIATSLPEDAQTLMDLRGVQVSRRHVQAMLDVLREARRAPVPQSLIDELRHQPAPIEPASLQIVQILLKQVSETEDLASKLVATSAELQQFLRIWPESSEGVSFLQGWRYEVFGKAACALLRGEMALHYQDGKIAFLPASR